MIKYLVKTAGFVAEINGVEQLRHLASVGTIHPESLVKESGGEWCMAGGMSALSGIWERKKGVMPPRLETVIDKELFSKMGRLSESDSSFSREMEVIDDSDPEEETLVVEDLESGVQEMILDSEVVHESSDKSSSISQYVDLINLSPYSSRVLNAVVDEVLDEGGESEIFESVEASDESMGDFNGEEELALMNALLDDSKSKSSVEADWESLVHEGQMVGDSRNDGVESKLDKVEIGVGGVDAKVGMFEAVHAEGVFESVLRGRENKVDFKFKHEDTFKLKDDWDGKDPIDSCLVVTEEYVRDDLVSGSGIDRTQILNEDDHCAKVIVEEERESEQFKRHELGEVLSKISHNAAIIPESRSGVIECTQKINTLSSRLESLIRDSVGSRGELGVSRELFSGEVDLGSWRNLRLTTHRLWYSRRGVSEIEALVSYDLSFLQWISLREVRQIGWLVLGLMILVGTGVGFYSFRISLIFYIGMILCFVCFVLYLIVKRTEIRLGVGMEEIKMEESLNHDEFRELVSFVHKVEAARYERRCQTERESGV